MAQQNKKPQYKPNPSYNIGCPVIGAYYKSSTPQIVLPNDNVIFNTKSLSRKISICNDDCYFIIAATGNFKIDFVLTLEPNSDISSPEAHIFGLVLNDNIISNGVFGSFQPNGIGSYQLCGSITQVITTAGSKIGLRNLSIIPVTLTNSINGIEITGASINIIKIE